MGDAFGALPGSPEGGQSVALSQQGHLDAAPTMPASHGREVCTSSCALLS